jgi:Core-2/I-Branching enzyme
MTFKLGFALLTHDRPAQAVRLVKRLNAMFDFPPIAWHHDFLRCPELPTEELTPNVTLVHPHIETGWQRFSIVEAAMRTIELLFSSRGGPDGFFLLSGSDYPIKPAERILQDVSDSPYDAHIAHEAIIYNDFDRQWQSTCYDRYCAIKLPWWRFGGTRSGIVRHPLLVGPFLPFTKNFVCYAGEFWFYGNRSAAEYLIAQHRIRRDLVAHYRTREFADESYFQTILCNSPLKISNYHWRYIDWHPPAGQRTPKRLGMEDLPRLRRTAAHFARKFDPDTEVLDALDAEIM